MVLWTSIIAHNGSVVILRPTLRLVYREVKALGVHNIGELLGLKWCKILVVVKSHWSNRLSMHTCSTVMWYKEYHLTGCLVGSFTEHAQSSNDRCQVVYRVGVCHMMQLNSLIAW